MNTSVAVNIAGNSVKVTVTKFASTVNTFLTTITPTSLTKPVNVIGLDIEWDPTNPAAKPATLQLSHADSCIVIQLAHLDSTPASLVNFLLNPNYRFVGVGIGGDVDKLKNWYGLGVSKYVELGPLAAQARNNPALNAAGLGELARAVLGVGVEKSDAVARSNWEAGELSADQIVYAATDAYVGNLVGSKLVV